MSIIKHESNDPQLEAVRRDGFTCDVERSLGKNADLSSPVPIAPSGSEVRDDTCVLHRDARRMEAVLLLVVLGVLMVTMPGFIYVGDAVSVRATSIAWLNTRSTAVLASYAANSGSRGQYFFEHPRTQQWTTKYGIANIFLYVPPLALEKWISGQLPVYEELDPRQYRLRCLVLGLYHTGMAVLLAAYLFRLTLLFGPRPITSMLFVLTAFFTTFLWNYLRAHTLEVFQVLFFTAMFYHLVRVHRMSPHRLSDKWVWPHVLMVVLFTSFLFLCKTLYVLLVPIVLVALALARPRRAAAKRHAWLPELISQDRGISFLSLAVIPLSLAVSFLLWTNWQRFGSVLETGYGQWEPMSEHFSLDVREALYGFSFDPRKSVFLHFPPAIFAILLFPLFLRRYPWEAAVGGLILLVFTLTISCFSYWRGDWSYGPRYLLFALPVASLPVLLCFEAPAGMKWLRPVFVVAMIPVMAWSAKCQFVVNSLEWFTPFRVESTLDELGADGVEGLRRHTYWTINEQLIALARADASTPLPTFMKIKLPLEPYAEPRRRLTDLLVINFLWWDLMRPVEGSQPATANSTIGSLKDSVLEK
jgi:hypothetical protein